MNAEPPLVFLVAGEPSGDALGGRLMAALKQASAGHVRFAGVGGPLMEAEGLVSLFPMSELSLMGLVEVLPRALSILKRIEQTAQAVMAAAPAAVVTIDSPGFTYRLARKLRKRGAAMPLIHYVAPQVWAWRPHAAQSTARLFDRLMVLLPFEPPYFEVEGIKTDYVGHPAIEAAGQGDGTAFRARHGIALEAPLLAVLPGSRRGETKRLLPVFGETVRRLAADRPGLVVAVPTLDTVGAEVERALASWPVRAFTVSQTDKYDCFAAATAALAASGTVTLELTIADLPFVAAYRANPLTAALVRRMIRVRFVTLTNLILDRPAVPELLQDDCRAETLAPAVAALLDDHAARAAQRAAFAEVRARLGADPDGTGPTPSQRAAAAVLEAMTTAC